MFSEKKPLVRVGISICGTFINQTPAYIHYRRPTPPTFTRYRRSLYTRQPVYQTRSGKWLLPVVTRRHLARYRYLNNSNKDLGKENYNGQCPVFESAESNRRSVSIEICNNFERWIFLIRFFNLWKNSHLEILTILRKWNWCLKFNYKFSIIKQSFKL